MNALLIALTMSLAGTAAPAPFPLTMSFYGAEAAVTDPALAALDLGSARLMPCVALELPSYAELSGSDHLSASVALEPRLTMSAPEAPSTSAGLGWLKDWSLP